VSGLVVSIDLSVFIVEWSVVFVDQLKELSGLSQIIFIRISRIDLKEIPIVSDPAVESIDKNLYNFLEYLQDLHSCIITLSWKLYDSSLISLSK